MGGRSNALAIMRMRNSCQAMRRSASVPPAKRKHLGLLLAAQDGHAAGAFDLVLPPADEAVMLFGCGFVEP